MYRLVDFALSNVVNSGYLKMVVLTQYKSHSLDRHVTKTWRMSTMLGNYVTPVPAQQRVGKHWYLGSADAIYQSLNLIHDEQPDIVVVVGADHVYRMDFSQMVALSTSRAGRREVAAIRQPIALADQFGVIEARRGRSKIEAFLEKPTDATGLPDTRARSWPRWATTTPKPWSTRSAATRRRATDMGGDIVPWFVSPGRAIAYDFKDNDVPGSTERDHGYWRDVGTLDAYYDAHMDLISVHPVFNLYNYNWPIYTSQGNHPPAKFVHGTEGRVGEAHNSAVSPGVVIRCIRPTRFSPRCPHPHLVDRHRHRLLDNVQVGRHAMIHRAILDKIVIVPRRGEDRR